MLKEIGWKSFVYLKELSAGLGLVVGFALVPLLVFFCFCTFLLLAVSRGVQTHDVGLHSLEVVILQQLLL